jgi:hypothetical protein
VSEEEVVQVASMADIGTPQLQVTVDDIVGAFREIDLTPLDDEPPDDLLLTPHDPTADISPAQHRAEVTPRLQQLADMVRPKASGSPSHDAPPPIDDAYADAMREQVDGDTRLAAAAKSSRTKAAGHTKAAWMFGNWKVRTAPSNDKPPPRDEAYADTMGKPSHNHDDYEENTI